MRILLLLIIAAMIGCTSEKEQALPYIGNHPNAEAGDYHKIPPFRFINQDSALVTNETFKGKVYVADFFFTSCPTICPIVTQQKLRIYEKFRDDDRVLLLSHSIDTKYDTVATLKRFADNLEISADKWHLVTGDKEEIFGMDEAYMSVAIEDKTLPGGFDHSGNLILVDQDGHVRAYCNGTKPEEVTEFMKNIEKLLDEG